MHIKAQPLTNKRIYGFRKVNGMTDNSVSL